MSDLLQAPAVEVLPTGPVRARIEAPASKSMTNRLLVIAALAGGTSRLVRPLDSDDARAMRALVQALGAEVVDDGGDWLVTGAGSALRPPGGPIDCGLSGTTMRFGIAVAALSDEGATLTGQPPLLRRPVGPLTAALRLLGADVRDDGGFPPVTAGGGLRGGVAAVDVSSSSQYASAILLAAPYAEQPVDLHMMGTSAEQYVTLTVAAMRRWGAAVAAHDGGWRVEPGAYRARDEVVEFDASAAAHLYALAVATGGSVRVPNAGPTLQPDADVVEVFAAMGAKVERDPDGTTVSGPPEPAAVDVDLGATPDQVTTVAALAALAPGRSTIRGVAVARGHETDRLAALATELGKLGVAVTERADGLVVEGGTASGPARLATYDDHRLAMAFAAVGARVPGVVIEHPGCVAKTYPHFWRDLQAAGVGCRSTT